ncbi:hypothetical protein T492DRAFT_842620 [Pavlovales sp. CCMP2436]|nr:hypothetical protein T492DRAFT_842620 [Pavlovales sp. CCMP2436]
MAQPWPPKLFEDLMPAIGAQMVGACRLAGVRESSSAAGGGVLEDAYRDARAAGTLQAKLPNPLLEAFGVEAQLLARGHESEVLMPPGCLLFAETRAKHFGSDGWASALEHSPAAFERNFQCFTSGLLDETEWAGLMAAGGRVLACALRTPIGPPPVLNAPAAAPAARSEKEHPAHVSTGARSAAGTASVGAEESGGGPALQTWLAAAEAEEELEELELADAEARLRYFDPCRMEPDLRSYLRIAHSLDGKTVATADISPFASSSDIDLFVVGDGTRAPTAAEAMALVRRVARTLRRNARGKVLVITTGSVVTSAIGYPKLHAQVVLKTFGSAADVLTSFDVDCCGFAFDGTRVLCTPRALRAAACRVNCVDLSRRSQTYEFRCARRGFAIGLPPLDAEQPGVEQHVRVGSIDELRLELHLAAERGTRSPVDGLLRLLIADRAALRCAQAKADKHMTLAERKTARSISWLTIAYNTGREGPATVGHEEFKQWSLLTPGATVNDLRTGPEADDADEQLHANGHAPVSTHGLQPVLYTAAFIPWQRGWDAEQIASKLEEIRQAVQDRLMQIALTLPRSSGVLPAKHVFAWGWKLDEVVQRDSFGEVERCISFFPRAAAGFTDGVYLQSPAERRPRYVLDCHPELAAGRPTLIPENMYTTQRLPRTLTSSSIQVGDLVWLFPPPPAAGETVGSTGEAVDSVAAEAKRLLVTVVSVAVPTGGYDAQLYQQFSEYQSPPRRVIVQAVRVVRGVGGCNFTVQASAAVEDIAAEEAHSAQQLARYADSCPVHWIATEREAMHSAALDVWRATRELQFVPVGFKALVLPSQLQPARLLARGLQLLHKHGLIPSQLMPTPDTNADPYRGYYPWYSGPWSTPQTTDRRVLLHPSLTRAQAVQLEAELDALQIDPVLNDKLEMHKALCLGKLPSVPLHESTRLVDMWVWRQQLRTGTRVVLHNTGINELEGASCYGVVMDEIVQRPRPQTAVETDAHETGESGADVNGDDLESDEAHAAIVLACASIMVNGVERLLSQIPSTCLVLPLMSG